LFLIVSASDGRRHQSIIKVLDEISDPPILGLLHRKALKEKPLEGFRQIVDLMME
jgi:hypothetical protein